MFRLIVCVMAICANAMLLGNACAAVRCGSAGDSAVCRGADDVTCREWLGDSIVDVVADVCATDVEERKARRLINEWEVSYGAGSPFGATEWRSLDNTVFTSKFTQMWQVNFCHQFSEHDYGDAPAGYYYPSMGFYLQWLDYSRLRIKGNEPLLPATMTADYGQIASAGWTLHQYMWARDKWRLHLNLECGAAYVFHPTYVSSVTFVTLAKPWQILIGAGVYLDRQVGHGELSLGPQFTHLSNSGLGAYNTGINNFSLCMRYRYKAVERILRAKAKDGGEAGDESRWYGSVATTLGGVYYEYSEHPNGQLTVMTDVMYRLSAANALGVGIDYFYNSQPDRDGRREYVGMAMKYDRWFGPFVIHMQGGAFLNACRPIKWKGRSRVYEHIGFKYVLMRHRPVSPYIGVYTKACGFNAEQMGVGVGVKVF